MSLKNVNHQRELSNYEFYHLYHQVKFGSNYTLQPRTKQIKEEKAGADTAEYGVQVTGEDGKRRFWRFSTYERCVQGAELRCGTILRLGRNSNSASFDTLSVVNTSDSTSFRAQVDESGNIEFLQVEQITVDASNFETISAELEELGWPKAIQYNSTRPPAKLLFDLHLRLAEVSFPDFAAAVVKHFEVPPPKKEPKEIKPLLQRTAEEKETWYSTPAGQLWLKKYSVPSILTAASIQRDKELFTHGRDSHTATDEGSPRGSYATG